MPTIRYDILPPAQRSVADMQNYGNEADCKSVVQPASYCVKGLNESDFDTLLSVDELGTIFANIIARETLEELYQLCEAQFATEIAAICKRDRNHKHGVTVDMMRKLLAKKTQQKIMKK